MSDASDDSSILSLALDGPDSPMQEEINLAREMFAKVVHQLESPLSLEKPRSEKRSVLCGSYI